MEHVDRGSLSLVEAELYLAARRPMDDTEIERVLPGSHLVMSGSRFGSTKVLNEQKEATAFLYQLSRLFVDVCSYSGEHTGLNRLLVHMQTQESLRQCSSCPSDHFFRQELMVLLQETIDCCDY